MIETPKEEVITDLDRMKNELLSYINKIESKVDMKLSLFETKQEASFNQFQRKVDNMGSQYTLMSETVTEQKVRIGKIDDLEAFKRKSEDQLISHEIRLNNIRKEFDRSVEKNDRIYVDNLVVPGYVGECAQFKNLREYVDYNIGQVSGLIASKDKLIVDLKEYKTKLEGLISLFSTQVEKYNKNQVDYINEKQLETKQYIAEQMKIINDEFIELRMANCKYAVDLKTKASELNIEWEKMIEIKKEIYKQYDTKLDEFKATEKKTNLNVFDLKNEFKKIKEKFNELVDFIKDVRFRKNLEKDNFEGIKKKQINSLTKKIQFTRKNSRSLDLGNRKEVDIDYEYDYFKGDNKSDSEAHNNQYLPKEIIEEDPRINATHQEPNKDNKNEDVPLFIKEKTSPPNTKPKFLKIAISEFKDKTEKSSLSNTIEMKRMSTEPKSYSPDLSKKRKNNGKEVGKPEVLRVVALNYDQQNEPNNSLFQKPKDQINVSFRPITLSRNEQGKKFKTVKENTQALKISFGASILNAKEGKIHRESIDCNQKGNCNFVLVNPNLLKQSP